MLSTAGRSWQRSRSVSHLRGVGVEALAGKTALPGSRPLVLVHGSSGEIKSISYSPYHWPSPDFTWLEQQAQVELHQLPHRVVHNSLHPSTPSVQHAARVQMLRDKTNELEIKVDKEVNSLKAAMEQSKNDTVK